MGSKSTMLGIVFFAVATLLAVTTAAEDSKTILPNLAYGNAPGIDTDNNGVESQGGAIDFSISGASFSWDANESNLCTLWRVLPLRQDTATLVCYGAAHCCAFADLASSAESWNEDFYLSPSLYGVAGSALVSAKVVQADYSLDPGQLYADITYSDWETLTAAFTPFSSTVILASDTTGPAIAVISPQNTSALSSGENITLSLTVNSSASAVYSLDGSANASMSGNASAAQSNYTATLAGTLPGQIISNGTHSIVITANSAQLQHSFTVSDNAPPNLTITPPINNSAINNSAFAVNVTLATNEFANFSYTFNSGALTTTAAVAHRAALSLTPVLGTNNLSVTALDMHGNAHSYAYTFNFSLTSTGTCQDSMQNYHDGQNETGVDCGGSCSACTTFNVSTDKKIYAPGELVYINVQARSDARHNISINGPGFLTSFAFNGSTTYIISPSNRGNYSINLTLTYRDLAPEYLLASFSVGLNDTLSAGISANATSISKNDTVAFSATVSGNTSLAAYSWDANNDGSVDSTAAAFNYTYTSPGTYTANLTLKAGTANATATLSIAVKPFYNLTITVIDALNATISSATATVDSLTLPATPIAAYELRSKTYAIQANASGYTNRTSSVTLSGNESMTFILSKADSTPPVVTLTNPPNNVTYSRENVTIAFTVSEEDTALCSVLLRPSGDEWITYSSISVTSTAEQTANFTRLLNSTYDWRITCTDAAGNSNTSETRSFTMLPNFVSSGEIGDIEKLIADITVISHSITSYGKLEQEAAETLQLALSLGRAKTELERTIRDLNNRQWRRFNTTDEQAYVAEVMNRVAIVRSNLTTQLSVLKTSKFVSYPDDQDITAAMSDYLDSQKKELSPSMRRSYLADSMALQQQAIITTDYKLVELTLYDGSVKTITLIEKTLDYSKPLNAVIVLETIPKTLAKSASQITPLFDHTIVKNDPVIAVTVPEGGKYAYYLHSSFTAAEVQSTRSILLHKEIPKAAASPTGFAVFSTGPLSSARSRLIAEAMLALVLAGIYFSYSKGAFHRQSAALKQTQASIDDIRAALQHNDYGKSKELYKALQQSFKTLPTPERKEIYATIAELRYEIDASYVKQRLAEAETLLSHQQRQAALSVYHDLTRVYKALPSPYRKGIYAGCTTLFKKLKEAQ